MRSRFARKWSLKSKDTPSPLLFLLFSASFYSFSFFLRVVRHRRNAQIHKMRCICGRIASKSVVFLRIPHLWGLYVTASAPSFKKMECNRDWIANNSRVSSRIPLLWRSYVATAALDFEKKVCMWDWIARNPRAPLRIPLLWGMHVANRTLNFEYSRIPFLPREP